MDSTNQRKMLRNEDILNLFFCGDKVFIEFVREKRYENRKERTRERTDEIDDRPRKSEASENGFDRKYEENHRSHENEADDQEISKNGPPLPFRGLQGILERKAIAFSGRYRMDDGENRFQLAVGDEGHDRDEGQH